MHKHTLYLLRHGKLKQQQVLAGHTDFVLSDEGQQQLIDAVSILPKIDFIYSSSLKRCAGFAKAYSEKNNIPLHVTDTLKEMNFGDWDGKEFDALWQESQDQITNINRVKKIHIGDFWEDPWKSPPPNGETMVQFTQRIDNWWQAFLMKQNTFNNDNINMNNNLLITHAGVIKHLLLRVVGLDVKKPDVLQVFDIPYAGIIRVDITYGESGKYWSKIVF